MSLGSDTFCCHQRSPHHSLDEPLQVLFFFFPGAYTNLLLNWHMQFYELSENFTFLNTSQNAVQVTVSQAHNTVGARSKLEGRILIVIKAKICLPLEKENYRFT